MPPLPMRGVDVTPQQQVAAIARLETEVRHLATAVDRMMDKLDAKMDAFESRMDEAQHLLDQGRGAWSTVVGFGAAAAALLTAGAWAFEHLFRGGLR